MTSTDDGPVNGTIEPWRRILVAVDGSVHSHLALDAAASLALRSNAELLVLSVSSTAGLSPAMAWGLAVDFTDLYEEVDLATLKILAAATTRVTSAVKITTQFRRGTPAHEILQQIEDGHHDLVVMGSRGRGVLGGLIGSVSHQVLHHSPVAVFVVHAPPE